MLTAYNDAMIGQGFEDRYLTDDETRAIVRDGLASLALDGKRVLFLIPDGTRTMPMPEMFDAVPRAARRRRASRRSTSSSRSARTSRWTTQRSRSLVGQPGASAGASARRAIFNHQWDRSGGAHDDWDDPGRRDPGADEWPDVRSARCPVTVNRLIFDYDVLVVCGPTFPHEVVGFSGGNNTSFPASAARRS